MTPTLQDFIGILYDAVRFYANVHDADGNVITCKRPNAFLPVLDLKDVLPENNNLTECEKYKKYFYSRAWEEAKYNNSKITYDYPAVICQWTGFSSEELMGERNNEKKGCEEINNFLIGVVRPYHKEKCQGKECLGCNGKNPFEIFLDCKEILDNILVYLKSVKRITITKGASSTNAWITKIHADYLKASGRIDSYKIDTLSTKEYIKMLSVENSSNKGEPYYNETFRNLYGVYIHFDFTTKQCIDVRDKFNFDKPIPKYIKDSCC